MSSCHCSSIKATDPVSIAASSPQYAEDSFYNHRALLFVYKGLLYPLKKKIKKSGPELCSQLLLIVAGDSHMPEHQEHFKTSPSSADGRPPWRNVFTAQHTFSLLGERAHAATGLACLGRRNRFEHTVLSAAFICIVLSASAGPHPGSKRTKDNNALSSLFF